MLLYEKSVLKKISHIGLEITVAIGKTLTNFLDVHLDLTLKIFHPYQKPTSKTIFINNGSNRPKIMQENIPKMIET